MLKRNDTPVYLPFMQYPELVHIGASRIDRARWIDIDADFNQYQQNKHQQYSANKDKVFVAAESSLPAQQELHTVLLQHLCADHNDIYQLRDDRLYLATLQQQWAINRDSAAPLWDCSLWVQDDICLLEKKDRDYVLTAASLCAPSHWRLEDKFGQDFFAIHQPVPALEEKLAAPIRRLLDKLDDQPLQRGNWSISDNPSLMALPEYQRADQCPADRPLFLRCERQTLRKLPATGAIVFTIRVYLHPLQSIIAISDAVAALKRSIDAMTAAEYDYKSLARLKLPLQAFFTEHRDLL